MELRGKKVTVVGMGRTAMSVVKLLLREGAEPFVTDSNQAERLEGQTAELHALGVAHECGGHSSDAFSGATWVLPSPGVSPRLDCIQQALASGAWLIGELELASWFNTASVLAVTGTNGKTTTTELLRALIAGCGHDVVLAGNNDTPFSSVVLSEQKPDYVVLEASSYQTELIRSFRPWIAAALNVTPDHLTRHGTLEGYAAAKARLFVNQIPGDIAVLNADDPRVAGMAAGVASSVYWFSIDKQVDRGMSVSGDDILSDGEPVARISDSCLPGRHNLANVLAALTMMRAGGFDWSKTIESLRDFRSVEHRIELVAERGGVAYYNDSKSTNLDSLRVALDSFDRPVILIAGGEGKGADYRVLRDLVRQHVKHLVLIGEDAPLLDAAYGDLIPSTHCLDMDEAVRRAASLAVEGDIVLLSPACASFDMFDNYEHRGRVFKECVRQRVGDLVP